jgi:5-methylcytosine-specific restriction protein A
MPNDPYYRTKEWQRLRIAALARDKHTCVVKGCNERASIVDHIVSRRRGGKDSLSNLRSLCRSHDNQTKEFKGKRRNDSFKVKGATPDGRPLDPSHPWNQ